MNLKSIRKQVDNALLLLLSLGGAITLLLLLVYSVISLYVGLFGGG